MSHHVNEYIDDIPMRLDIRYQPLDFGVYLDEAAAYSCEKHNTLSLDYTFDREIEALENVNRLLEQQIASTTNRVNNSKRNETDKQQQPGIVDEPPPSPHIGIESTDPVIANTQTQPQCSSNVPSFTTFGPLTPIALEAAPSTAINIANGNSEDSQLTQMKEDHSTSAAPTEIHYPTTTTSTNTGSSAPAANLVNPCDFEDINYNPFDHVEMQTIDELQELNLIFQKSYASGNISQ